MTNSLNTQRLSRQSEKGIMTTTSYLDLNKIENDQLSKEIQL